MQTNKEQNQSGMEHWHRNGCDFLMYDYGSCDCKKQIQALIHQAEREARNEVISKLRPYIDELEKIKTAEQCELQLVAFARAIERLPEIIAELERGSNE